MDLFKREEESPLEYHKRLVYGKLIDRTLADVDYSELAELLYGKPYSSDVARRMCYGSCKTLQLLDKERKEGFDDKELISELDSKILEMKKERQKFYDQRSAYSKMLRERSREEELNEIIISTVKSGKLPQLQYVKPDICESDNDLIISLNDIHYGANVNNYWNVYNSEICRKMMNHYLDKIIAIGKIHRSENCYVCMNGDAISGNIHLSIAITNKENVIEQVEGVSELISEFLAELSKHFKRVIFVSVAGNHSRIEKDKNKALLGECLDNLVEWYAKARLQDFENIFVGGGEKIDHTMYLLDVRNQLYVGIHGDWDANSSNVQTLQTMAKRPIYAVLSGHKHHNKTDNVQGIRTFMAGSFLGIDDFCVQKRIYSKPEQMVCVCDNNGVRCFYDVELTY